MPSTAMEESIPSSTATIVAAYLEHREKNTVITEDELVKLIKMVGGALRDTLKVQLVSVDVQRGYIDLRAVS